MTNLHTPALTTNASLFDSEIFPELISATHHSLERGDALEAYRAFDDGALAAVPHALEAWMSHQRFNLN